MRVTVIPVGELSDDLVRTWCRLQEANPDLRGPCLRPELYVAVGRHYPGARVAVVEEGGVAGFLPFVPEPSRREAKPVPMCDYQALIAPAHRCPQVLRVLRAAGLWAWDFDHLVAPSGHWGEAATAEATSSPRVVIRRTDFLIHPRRPDGLGNSSYQRKTLLGKMH
jgi:hypothetical protein